MDMRDAAVVEPERAWSGVGGLTGEGGAYISESRASDEDEVSPTRTCLTLSDCVCVLRRAEWTATRRGEEGGEEGALIDVINLGTKIQTAGTHMLSSSWRRLMASLTVESHRCAAAMRSLSAPKAWAVSRLV